MLRLLICLVLATATSAITPEKCQSSADSSSSNFDVDYNPSRSLDINDGVFRRSGVLYAFDLQSHEYQTDDCSNSCCYRNATISYVIIELDKKCGPPETDFVEGVIVDGKPLETSKYSLAATSNGSSELTIKLPPKKGDSLLGVVISDESLCGQSKYFHPKKPDKPRLYGPCERDGCPVRLITQVPGQAGCCTTTSFTNIDPKFPENVTLPENTGKIDVSSYPLNFMLLGDWGSPPYEEGYTRVEFVAKAMAAVARKYSPKAVLNVGDNFYNNGLLFNRSSPSTSLDKTVWEKLFINPHPELQIPWYGVLGNHDYNWNLNNDYEGCGVNCPCYAETKEKFETQQCIASPILQQEGVGVIKNKNWRLRNGTWTVKNLGGQPGLVDLIMFDSNTQQPHYLKDPKYNPPVYGGIHFQDGKRVEADLFSQIDESNATWRIVMGHHPIMSYAKRCIGEVQKKNQFFPFNISECKTMEAIRNKVFSAGIPLYLNGHAHQAELIKNKTTYMLNVGNGFKHGVVQSMPPADSQYLVYGHAVKRESNGKAGWYESDVGFSTLHVKDDALVIKIWGIGYNQPPNVPANALSLHFEIKLDRKDFPYPNKKSPAPQPGGVPPSPVPQPAASPPAVPSASPPPTPGAQPPSPAPIPSPVLPSPPLLSPPAPVLSSPPPPPGSPAAVPPSG